MPAVTPFSPRVEFSDRPMARRTSPARSPVLVEVHSGLCFHNGTQHNGGRSHNNIPRDHEVIVPKRCTGMQPLIAGDVLGRSIVLRRGTSGSPVRVQPKSQISREIFGRKHIIPQSSGNPTTLCPSTDAVRNHMNYEASPRNSFIAGLQEKGPCDVIKPRGQKHLEGCPQFALPTFDKRRYSPHTRQVPAKPVDHDVFLTQTTTTRPPRCESPRRGNSETGRNFNIITGV